MTGHRRAVNSALAWRGEDFAPRAWTRPLPASARQELIDATRALMASDATAWNLREPAGSVLESLHHTMTSLRLALDEGPGFAVLTGFPVDVLSPEALRVAYALTTRSLGRLVVQNGRGDHMVDVRDDGKTYSHRSRGYSGNDALPYHTDGTKGEAFPVQYTALLCLDTSRRGGLSTLASAAHVYNRLLELHPEALEPLERGFRHHRQGDQPDGHSPVSSQPIPVFSFSGSRLRCRYNRKNVEWAEREGVMLTQGQREALDIFDAQVAEPGVALSMEMRKGDLQILSNFAVLHSRTAYEDEGDHRRHLIRAWLYDPRSPWGGEDLIERFAPPDGRFAAV